jgi:imidazolonepropionase-like amidohydrolase
MTADEVSREIRAYLRGGSDFLKYASSEHRWHEHETTASMLFSSDAQAGMVNEAHCAGITAQAHTTSVEALRVAVEAGCDLIQHCNITGPVPIPDRTLRLLAESQTGAVVFAFTRRRLEMLRSRADAGTRRYFATIEQNCKNLTQCGAPILLATDSGVLSGELLSDPLIRNSWVAAGEDNPVELGTGHFLWLQAMAEQGLSPMQLLCAATKNIALAYKKEQDLGTLEPGKFADLLVLNKDPLQAPENYRSIDLVLKGGVIVDTERLPSNPILTLPPQGDTDEESRYGRYATSKFPMCC